MPICRMSFLSRRMKSLGEHFRHPLNSEHRSQPLAQPWLISVLTGRDQERLALRHKITCQFPVNKVKSTPGFLVWQAAYLTPLNKHPQMNLRAGASYEHRNWQTTETPRTAPIQRQTRALRHCCLGVIPQHLLLYLFLQIAWTYWEGWWFLFSCLLWLE